MLDFHALSKGKRILDVDAEIANSALNLGMAEQNLHGTEVAGLLVDDRRLGPTQRVGPVIFWSQPDSGHPLVDQAGILPRTDMPGVIDPARKGEVVKRAASAVEPSQHAFAARLE